ncbi:MAG: [protein-PII] uridylyltransferase [Hylemonella sp.]|nr:[protein-PII] uridylyltransferase [Hylemonella sp.]
MHATPALREQYQARKAALLKGIADSGASARGIRAALRQQAQLADETLKTLWRQAGLPPGLALLAVGGYGRSELFPYSDIDVLLLLPDGCSPDRDEALRQCIENFIRSCWDSGLEIGSSVRTTEDCLSEAQRDVTVQTALLESRLICGPQPLFEAMQIRFRATVDARAFYTAKTLEMNQRHHKFEDTPYALEPNCKESPGGLRDLQIILWVANAAGYGRSWDELARNGLATPYELKQLKHNEALLHLIRMRLHLLARRREDRLAFDLQATVAESFGFVGTGTAPDSGKPLVRASEMLMRDYYWTAKAVVQLNQILLLNIEERLLPSTQNVQPINAHFSDKAGFIEVASDDLYQRAPHAILETFLVYQGTKGAKGLSARTLRALYNARDLMDGRFRSDPVNRETFMRILMQRKGVMHAMRLMNQTSVLGRYLWAFRRIVGQMQHDLFHVYTVDQHTLMVLRNMRRFFVADHAHEYPFCSQLAAGWDKPWVLYAAALFHDIAKGRGGDHSALGALEVRRFCRRHGVAREDARLIEFLVREHLAMSHTAQKADLSDPEVIRAFAARVGDERQLTALYLLTVADIRGTSPKVWNAWKGKLLEDLYQLTVRTLGGHTASTATTVETRKREALVLLALHAQPHEAEKRLWDTLDVSYFMRHEAADIAWHTRHLSRLVDTDKVIVRARRSLVGEGLQVLVYTRDQPDLFARICGYFDHSNFSIIDARIHTTRSGYALDTFQIITPDLSGHYRELTTMVEIELAQAIAATTPLPEPTRGRLSRRVKSFPITPRVTLRPDEKAQRWLLSITANDQAGLLYKVARVMARHRINLQLAKINTLGERVDDTFLIDGAELQKNRSQIAFETELLNELAP